MLGWCQVEHTGCGAKAPMYEEWFRAADDASDGDGTDVGGISMNDIICAEDHQGSGMSLSARAGQAHEGASVANWFSPGRSRNARASLASSAKDGDGENGCGDTTSSTASTCSSEVSFGDLSSVDSARKSDELETRGARPQDGRRAAKTLLPSNRPCSGRLEPFGYLGPPRGKSPSTRSHRPASAETRRPLGSGERVLSADSANARRRGSSAGRSLSGGSSSSSALAARASVESLRHRGGSAGRASSTRHLFLPHGRWGSGAVSLSGLHGYSLHSRGHGQGVVGPAPLTPHLSRHTSVSDLSPIVENTWSNEKETIFHAGPAPREEGREGRPSEKLARAFLLQEGFDDSPNARKKTRSGLLSTGYTYPLHAAVLSNCPDVVEGLLRIGASSEQADSSGRTPLELAERLNKDGSHERVVRALLSC
mmetsp:Transcript_56068/g.157295  ORF Transcript_56068/g.157295 Transcript_56068/m.157295 type:complete len:424 (-) Transcript_56068:482-1753(-)